MLSNCGHDERYQYSGGKAGDQTGGEWEIIGWYNRPWDCVLRYPDKTVRGKIAELAEKAARNNLIGYDQYQRMTFWQHLKASNYDPAQITVACEADCSSGIAAIVKATGYLLGNTSLQNVSADLWTGNMKAAFRAAGCKVYTARKYRESEDYLRPGDILLNEAYHVATNLTEGKRVKKKKSTQKKYKVGAVVEFVGTRHYISANDTNAKTCKPGKAKVTQVYNGIHPYHLIAIRGGGSTVYGWVDAEDVRGNIY